MSLDLVIGGNILAWDAEAIVIPVNCVGVMGAGLAKDALAKWADRCQVYMVDCRQKTLRPGGVTVDTREGERPRVLLFAATKDHWRNSSRIEWIARAGKSLVAAIDDLNLSSVAVPALGCGKGGLSWSEVQHTLGRAFINTTAKVSLFAPVDSQ